MTVMQMSFCYEKGSTYNFGLQLVYSWEVAVCPAHRKDITRADSWVRLIFLT